MKQTVQLVAGTTVEDLKIITTSCMPEGHTPKTENFYRSQHFAPDDFFGGLEFFLTTAP